MKRRSIKLLNSVEIAALKGACETYMDQLLIFVLLYTGMRINELINLKPSWIDFNRKTITIPEKDGSFHPKTIRGHCSNRTVEVLNDETMWLLRGFKSFSMTPLQSWRRLRQLAKKAGLAEPNISPHLLRHTHLSLMAFKGFTITAIADQAGHKNTNIVQDVYIHGNGIQTHIEREKLGNL